MSWRRFETFIRERRGFPLPEEVQEVANGLELDWFRGFYDDAAELQGIQLPGTDIEIYPTSEMLNSRKYPTVVFEPNLTTLAREKYEVIAVNGKDILEGAI